MHGAEKEKNHFLRDRKMRRMMGNWGERIGRMKRAERREEERRGRSVLEKWRGRIFRDILGKQVDEEIKKNNNKN